MRDFDIWRPIREPFRFDTLTRMSLWYECQILKGSRIGCRFSKFLRKTDISDAGLMCIANYYLQIMYPVQNIVVNIVLCLSSA